MDSPTISFDRAKEVLSTIGVVKQDVYHHSYAVFEALKLQAMRASEVLEDAMSKVDTRVKVSYKDVSKNEFWLQFGGDLLIFSLHTNVFAFDKSHSLYNSLYVQFDPHRSYFSMIEVFNFLSDSVTYSRYRDVGELVARIFVNAENHFFMEGLGPLGSLYTDLTNQVFDENYMQQVLEGCIVSSVQYDLWVPPFNDVRFIPLAAIVEQNGNSPRTISKRVGYDIGVRAESNNEIEKS